MTALPDRWLVATSERVLFTLDTGLPTAVTPYWVTKVRPISSGSGTLISFSGDSPIAVTDDFATVMDRLSGKRT